MDNKQCTNEGLLELALFAGAGGGILGGHLLGWKTVCAVEWEPYPACVLAARQNDGILPPFPIWDDVQTFDGKPWRGIVDVVSGGFPCQDISSAGKGAGIEGSRSSMWKHMARIIDEVRPRFAFVENSPMLVGRGAAMVIGDLAEMGYDCQWCIVSASDCGAPHQRDRFWLVAHAKGDRYQQGRRQSHVHQAHGRQDRELRTELGGTSKQPADMADPAQLQRNGINDHAGISMESGQVPESRNDGWSQDISNAYSAQQQGNERAKRSHAQRTNISKHSWWASEPDVGRVADRVAARVDRLKAIGNGQVPCVAATAWRILNGA